MSVETVDELDAGIKEKRSRGYDFEENPEFEMETLEEQRQREVKDLKQQVAAWSLMYRYLQFASGYTLCSAEIEACHYLAVENGDDDGDSDDESPDDFVDGDPYSFLRSCHKKYLKLMQLIEDYAKDRCVKGRGGSLLHRNPWLFSKLAPGEDHADS